MKKRVWIGLLVICLLVGLFTSTALAAGSDGTGYDKTLYVSTSAAENGDGTKEAPFDTLDDAVGAASGKTLIYLMSDITLTSKVGIWEKNITIASEPDAMAANGRAFTISRGDNFSIANDSARSNYNPAMIEVGGTTNQGVVSYLRLENIILDDRGIAQGGATNKYFIQASSKGTGSTSFGSLTTENGNPISNTDIVQDAIIATYNGTGEITLGYGAVLKNYGGMSAVRISGGKLIMEKGSVICDDSGINRTNGTTIPGADGLYGPAGAVWIQGGELVMEDDSEIRDMVGRAVYADGGSVSTAGTIKNIKCSGDSSVMWQKSTGYIVHLRSNATCTLNDGFCLTNDFTSVSDSVGTMFNVFTGSEFTMHEGAKIINLQSSGNCLYINGGTATINGEISGVNTNGNHIIQATEAELTIEKQAELCRNKVSYGTVYIQGGNTVDIYGKINYNYSTDRGGAVAITNHGDSEVNMYPGAEMIGNYSQQTGGGLLVSDGIFTMYGGTISQNCATMDGGGVFVRQGGSFIMKDGTITCNYTEGVGGGVAFQSDQGRMEITGGTLSGNYMLATVTPDADAGTCTAEGGQPNDVTVTSGAYSNINRCLTISDDVVLGEQSIYMEKHDFYLENIGDDVKLGNTSNDNENSLETASAGKGWSDSILAALWLQSDDAQELVFSGIDDIDDDLPVYALAMATDANGDVASGTTATVYAVTENTDGTLAFNIHPTGENGCAIAFVQPGTHYGTLVKAGEPSSIAFEDFDGEHATISYKTTYTLSENIKNQIITDGHPFILSINLDDNLSLVEGTLEVDGVTATASTEEDSEFINVPFTVDNDTDTVVVTFDAKLHVDDFIAGGQLISASEVSTTIGTTSVSIPSNAVITDMEPFTISASAGSGGSISPNGDVEVEHNGNVTFTITPDSGYEIADVLVDGVSVGAVSTYEFETVTSNHTISATFKSKGGGSVGVTGYTITASAGDGGTISPSGVVGVSVGGDKTFTITADKGYDIAYVLVDGKSVGAVSSYTFENITSSHTIKAVFAKIGAVVDPDDTGVSDWLNTNEHFAYLSGYGGGIFAPERNMTRAEAAQMFYNLLLDKDVAITVAFDDVPDSAWYSEAVNTLASLGMIKGVGDNKFEPDRSITRAEFTAIAMRFTKGTADGENSFSDVSANDWFYAQVVGSAKYGWISGYPDGTFRPNNTITRAEVTTIVNRMLGRVADENYIDAHMGELTIFTDVPSEYWGSCDIIEATNAHDFEKVDGAENWVGLK